MLTVMQGVLGRLVRQMTEFFTDEYDSVRYQCYIIYGLPPGVDG